MRGYDRYEDEDLDEYEEDGEEEYEEEEGVEEEYEEEEDPRRSKEVLDYLELRQRLKEEKRKELKKELGAGSSRDKKNVMPKHKDNYGSFFGPSQPVIAQRVIQESKSLLENPNLATKVLKASQKGNKSSSSAPERSKTQANGQRPKVTNGLQTKVQMLKNTRDYSFLLSDDAEVPAPSKDPPRNVYPPKSEARTGQLPERSRETFNNNGRKVLNGQEDKKPTSTASRVELKVARERLGSVDKHIRTFPESRKTPVSSNRTLADPRKQHLSSNGSGPDRPVVYKGHSSSNGSGPGRPVVSKGHSSSNGSGPGRPVVSKGHSSSNGSGPGRPVISKGVPAARLPTTSSIQKPAPPKSHPPASKQGLIRKGESQQSRKPNLLPKQMAPPSRPKVTQPSPKYSARRMPIDDRPMKKPRRHDDEEEDDAIMEIRKMFGYNPRRYADDDVDDSDMVVNFNDIVKEEKRSARIARKEDEEELRKIEEEERRERLRREAKKRKMR